jgi:ADP-ribose pyrophosphatase YjhB (NUDIX family)
MTTTSISKPARFKIIVDVHLILRDGDNILLGKRINTGYGDGAFHPPAGHMEEGESATSALIREAKEEIGVTIHPDDVNLVHVMHNSSSGGRIAFFFEVDRWDGQPTNIESDKCAGWQWFSLGQLPDKMIPYAQEALRSYTQQEVFSLHGW